VLAGCGAGETDPDAGVDAAAACDRRQPQVDGDQGESTGDGNFRSGGGFAQMSWADPQHPVEVDTRGTGRLGGEPVAEIDQGRVFAAGSSCRQAGEHGGEPATADVAANFGQGSVGKPTAKQPIELAASGGQVVAFGVQLIGTPQGVPQCCRKGCMQRRKSGGGRSTKWQAHESSGKRKRQRIQRENRRK
jgi:hypothetical protein